MQVILLEKVANLGNMGEVVTVKPGYARNYLLSLNKALPATKENMARYEAEKAQLEKENSAKRTAAETLASSLGELKVSLERQASETGQLYGSVKPGDIQKAITALGHHIPSGSIALAEPIKAVGDYTATLSLHPEVQRDVAVTVIRQVM